MKRERPRGIGPYSRKRRREAAPAPPVVERDKEGPMSAREEPAGVAEALRRKRSDRRH